MLSKVFTDFTLDVSLCESYFIMLCMYVFFTSRPVSPAGPLNPGGPTGPGGPRSPEEPEAPCLPGSPCGTYHFQLVSD